MSVKVDEEKSTKARNEGNASFKKGKWTEAIGHYTTAIVFNPADGLGYTNRAAAYLKLDKWKDAERDCTSAIALPKGGENVKARYRRALARKALEDFDGAASDIDAVLSIEPTNQTAQEEKAELLASIQKKAGKPTSKPKAGKSLPPSPPRAEASITEIHEPEPESEPTPTRTNRDLLESENQPIPSSNAKGSFADLKKGRQAGRKTFALPDSAPSPSSLPLADVRLDAPSPPPTIPSAETKSASPRPVQGLSDASLPLPDPTSPGSALSFISSIRTHGPLPTYPVIQHLASRPEAVGKMMDNILEPDQLALILSRLSETLDVEISTQSARREVVKRFIDGLKMTKRWGMTSIMLSSKERALGQYIWAQCVGQGDWAKL